MKPENHAAFHLYVVRVKPGALKKTHREIFESLRATGIGVNVHYMPVHLQPYYRNLGFSPGQFPEAERYYAEAISLPMYPGLAEAEQNHVIESLKSALVSPPA